MGGGGGTQRNPISLRKGNTNVFWEERDFQTPTVQSSANLISFPSIFTVCSTSSGIELEKSLTNTHVQPARDDEDSAETELEASSAERGCIYLIKNTVKL